MSGKDFTVRAVRCDHTANDEAVYEALERATAPLTQSWDKLESARRIVVKFNQDGALDSIATFEGHRQYLVSEAVVRAVCRLLRARTDAEIVCGDISLVAPADKPGPEETTSIAGILDEYGIGYVSGNLPPFRWMDVPGGGQMFRRYAVMGDVADADCVVSVAKIKNHAFTGVTACLKNLFGLMPTYPAGRPRSYYHHLVRLPYVLADIGRLFDPVLNIGDMIVSHAGSEWGYGGSEPRMTDTLIAGDNVVATDACTMRLMGHDPTADYLTPPFVRDRNHVLIAAEGGHGAVDLETIDFESDVDPAAEGEFFAARLDPPETVASWRQTMATQALFYRDNPKLFEPYRGQFILLQARQVIWHDTNPRLDQSRRILAGDKPDESLLFKYVDPDDAEGEHYEVYEPLLG
ncbi:hypothetical protein LCGC14_0016910 [marine sediment metagenome]|uniref:DUF362 domain-containing protein n=1 Tax=marine sediment metagenome TaxID=412755 RepID=A0A0F9W4C5_9ZZZZ|nr:DUF362 domain-containing protein [Phycisphaerae bacterium]HDZ42399.1 DUF362 domain-containing protein [Phycisphaerae bacterium]